MSKKDSSPATKADLELAVDELAQSTEKAITYEVKSLRGDMKSMDDKMATKKELAEVKDTTERTLQIVESIDERLKNAGDIGARLDKLEERSFSR